MLDINLMDFRAGEYVLAYFFLPGAKICNEMTLVLHSPGDQWRKITLDPVTAFELQGDFTMKIKRKRISKSLSENGVQGRRGWESLALAKAARAEHPRSGL